VNLNKVGSLMMLVGLLSSNVVWANGLDETATAKATETAATAADTRAITIQMSSAYEPHMKRPAALPALYVTLGVMQIWDLASTSAALKAGAHEANPAAAPFADNKGSMMALKAVTTASTIFFAERAWKKNKVAAVVMMVAINGGMAAVAMNNMRNARALATR
jgi:hypothetical protein